MYNISDWSTSNCYARSESFLADQVVSTAFCLDGGNLNVAGQQGVVKLFF